jgi:serine/threonine protein kinase
MDTFVAIKILYKEFSSNQAAINRFTQEAKMLAGLKHPNILSITDFGMTGENEPYLVMEYLEGTSLEEYLEKHGRMPIEQSLNVFIQACDGLGHAHSKGVIHRDLKPGNLMLIKGSGGNEQVKLLDFGIAKMKGESSTAQQKLTVAGEIYGSPLYMSPEQCEGKPLDERSDLYSLGCVIYETLTSMPPLMGANSFETMTKHVREMPLPLRGAAPDIVVPDLIDFVVMKALEKSPEKRQQSALELKGQLIDAAVRSNVHFQEDDKLYSPKPYATWQHPSLPGVLPTPKDPPAKQTEETSAQANPASDLERQELEKLIKEAQTYTLQTQAKAKNMQNLLLLLGGSLILALISAAALLMAPGPESDPAPDWQKELWRMQMAAGDEAAARAARNNNNPGEQESEYARARKEYTRAIETGKQMGPIYDKQVKAEQALLQVYEARGDAVACERLREQLFNDHLNRELLVYGSDGADERALPDLDKALLMEGLVDPGKLDRKFADQYSHKLIDSARTSFRQKKYVSALRYLEEAVSLEEHAHRRSNEVEECANEFAVGLNATQADRKQIEQLESLLKRAQSVQR